MKWNEKAIDCYWCDSTSYSQLEIDSGGWAECTLRSVFLFCLYFVWRGKKAKHPWLFLCIIVWRVFRVLFLLKIIFVWPHQHFFILSTLHSLCVVVLSRFLHEINYTCLAIRSQMFQMVHLPLIYHQVYATCAHFKRIHTFSTHCTRIAVHMSYVGGPNEILLQCVAFTRMLSTKFALFIWFYFLSPFWDNFSFVMVQMEWNIKLRQTARCLLWPSKFLDDNKYIVIFGLIWIFGRQRPFPMQCFPRFILFRLKCCRGICSFCAIFCLPFPFHSCDVTVKHAEECKKKKNQRDIDTTVDKATRLLFGLYCILYALLRARHVSIDTFHQLYCSAHHSFHQRQPFKLNRHGCNCTVCLFTVTSHKETGKSLLFGFYSMKWMKTVTLRMAQRYGRKTKSLLPAAVLKCPFYGTFIMITIATLFLATTHDLCKRQMIANFNCNRSFYTLSLQHHLRCDHDQDEFLWS